MSAKRKLVAAGLAAGAAAGACALSPPYMRSSARGFLYAAGLKQVPLPGLGRVVATILGKPDYPPCFAQMHEHVQYISGVAPREFYLTDGYKMAVTTKLVNDYYGMDVPLPFTDTYNIEAEAMGATMIAGDIDMPTIDYRKPLVENISDIDRIDIDFQPDWGRIGYVIDTIRAMREVCGLPELIIFCAPFSLAVGLRSYPKLIRDMRKDPPAAHALMTWITEEVHPRYLGLLKRETGARIGIGADAWAAFPNLTVDMVEEWVVPYNSRLRRRMKKEGMALILIGAADYCEEQAARFDRETMEACWLTHSRSIVGDWAVNGMPFMGMGRTQEWPLEWMQEFAVRGTSKRYGKKAILASVNARFIREGPAEAIVDFVKRTVDVLAREGKFFIFLAQVPAATPPEHVHAAVAALKTYGRYPIAEDLDGVEFRVPEFEPFDVWLRKQG
ncbi:MAG: uroporphyrinogen decarboxylase family protein [Actinomycetota bacterium]|nr:uroporphyrinogen decarboxylase family protein [Actinomycetota bacterium]